VHKYLFPHLLAILLSPTALTGCVGFRPAVHAPSPVGYECGVVFVADGAGGFMATSTALSQAIADVRLPLRVETADWGHGFGRVLADEVDFGHARREGQCLAAQVLEVRRCRPDLAVYLVGHSAGSAVVLAAAEALPPGSVERIVLLAPSVSAGYDLRPALRCVRRSVDVFCSARDWAYLGIGVSLVGTTDRCWTAAGGRTGFRQEAATTEDAALYAKLRQHPWDPCVAWTGNRGGHYGAHQPEFVRAYVLPLLTQDSDYR
jgi:pimeloyl-ACP methyl ester carboxylesterase